MGWSWLPSLVHARLGSGFPWRRGLGMYLLKEKGKLDPDFFLIDSKSLHWVCPPPPRSEVKAMSKDVMT